MTNHNTQTRMTRQRRIILDELRLSKKHPTADELFENVRRKLPKISLGTVYRNLEILSDQGVIKKLHTAGTQMRFDGDLNHHFHMRCTRCRAIVDLVEDLANTVEVSMPAVEDFEITGYTLEYSGICRKCSLRSRQ